MFGIRDQEKIKKIEGISVDEMLVSDLEPFLFLRASNCMKNGRLTDKTIGELLKISDKELLSIHNFGKRCLVDIKNAINDLKLKKKG